MMVVGHDLTRLQNMERTGPCVHDAKNKYRIFKNKLLVYGGV